ncbi:hypothetical protein ACPOL_6659 [Acidisarcina polymorpha]|uniref:HdeD family acid-resistance protein n=1 Tax=Acidisarcina polymorpha TaxID=2211140 RepID=A0A2Z5G9P2_9BACT|nr:HdeD family acid-resistance protein [Acidisarcina polymorpha]AXC15871.1 hypothetical protein ACPOL_6659 [Acidisarcina polymorpha]
MNDTALSQPLKTASGWGIAFAILIIIAGILAISLPLASGIGITIVVGWLLVFSGIFHIADAFHAKGAGSFFWRLLVGIVFIIGGLDLAFVPLRGLFTLTFVLAIILLVQGVIGIVSFFRHRGMTGAPWILINGLITLFLGLLIWWDGPGAAVWVIGTLVGVNLIFSGISRLMIWGAVRKSLTA